MGSYAVNCYHAIAENLESGTYIGQLEVKAKGEGEGGGGEGED